MRTSALERALTSLAVHFRSLKMYRLTAFAKVLVLECRTLIPLIPKKLHCRKIKDINSDSNASDGEDDVPVMSGESEPLVNSERKEPHIYLNDDDLGREHEPFDADADAEQVASMLCDF